MGFVENFKTLKTEDQKEIVKKEASYTNIGYNIFDAKSHISKASKKDFLDPIKTFVESKKILKRRYLFIDEIEDKGSVIFIPIKWNSHILLISLADSSEGTLIISELITKESSIEMTSMCSDIISSCLKQLNMEDEKKSFKSQSRKEGIKSVAKYGISEIIKCLVGVFIIIFIGAIIRAIF